MSMQPDKQPLGGEELAGDEATLDVFLGAYAHYSDGEVIASVIDPLDDLLTLGALRRIHGVLLEYTALKHDLERQMAIAKEAENEAAKLREALERVDSDCASTISLYERNGPSYTSSWTGEKYESASFVQNKMHELRSIARTALGGPDAG